MEKKTVNATYRLENMMEEKFFFNYNYDFSNINFENVVFSFNHTISPDYQSNKIAIVVNVDYVLGESILASETIRSIFIVNPVTEIVQPIDGNDNRLSIKAPELIATFINVAIGALRGLFVKNLKGTSLENCVLTLVPMDLILEQLRK